MSPRARWSILGALLAVTLLAALLAPEPTSESVAMAPRADQYAAKTGVSASRRLP